MNAQEHFERKLAHEIDSSDLDAARGRGENIVLIDARSREAWRRQRIPGAIGLPHREMNAETTAAFDRNALIVTYCDGIGCNASTKGALAMARLGFRVKELIGGIDWWKRDGYSTEGDEGQADMTDDPDCAC